jgi:hypothetical protein
MTAWTVVALTAICEARKRNRRCEDDVGVREGSRAEIFLGKLQLNTDSSSQPVLDPYW